MVAPQLLDDDCAGQWSLVVVGACHSHRRAVKAWQESRSVDGTALVMDVDTMRRNWSSIFGNLDTPVVGLQRATA